MVNANYCKTSFVHFPCEIECSYEDDDDFEEEKYNQEAELNGGLQIKYQQNKHKSNHPCINSQRRLSTARRLSTTRRGSNARPLVVSDEFIANFSEQEINQITSDTMETYCVVIIGELSVGKSALCRSFFESGKRNCTPHSPTNYVENEVDEETPNHHIYERPVKIEGKNNSDCRLRILDINTERHLEDCCDDHFASMTSYMDIGDAFVIAYAVTDVGTFETAHEILEHISKLKETENTGEFQPPIILVGNKCDLVRKRKVTVEEGIRLAEEFGTKFIETSANLNLNTDKLFEGTIRQIRLRKERHLLSVEPPMPNYDFSKKRKSRLSLGSFGDHFSLYRSESVRSNFLSTNTSSRMSSYHSRHRKSTASVTPWPGYKVPQQLQQMTSSKSFACEQGSSSKELDIIDQPKSSRSFFKKCKSRLMKTFSSVSNPGNSQKKTVCQDLSIL